ncbi:hypothetical protein [Streptomyces sp. NPDC007905]|uniref:hypothetical protein n=1 Tax=Streptomyces sp. NPDC007905 TaxID=3364788 RepID=UPI0036ECC8B4
MILMTLVLFTLSAALILTACVKAERVPSWRESLNPSGEDVPDSALTIARVVLPFMAVLGIYYGFQSLAMTDEAAWSHAELTSTVRSAMDAFEDTVTYGEGPADLDDGYALKIEDEITRHGGPNAPDTGVDVTRTTPGHVNVGRRLLRHHGRRHGRRLLHARRGDARQGGRLRGPGHRRRDGDGAGLRVQRDAGRGSAERLLRALLFRDSGGVVLDETPHAHASTSREVRTVTHRKLPCEVGSTP